MARRTSTAQHNQAKAFGQNSTRAEWVLWQHLRDRQLASAKFRRQQPFGSYILDFYCSSHKLVVEVDGGQHYLVENAAADAERTRFLEGEGLRVLRFSNSDVLQSLDGVVDVILGALTSPSP